MWVREAEFRDEAWEPDAPTFALVEFFTFETEATPVLDGRQPRYDFAASYRVTVDDFLLKYLATQRLVVEVPTGRRKTRTRTNEPPPIVQINNIAHCSACMAR